MYPFAKPPLQQLVRAGRDPRACRGLLSCSGLLQQDGGLGLEHVPPGLDKVPNLRTHITPEDQDELCLFIFLSSLCVVSLELMSVYYSR